MALEEASEPSHHGGDGPFILLRDRNFGPYFFGKIASSSGIWTQNIAGAILMYHLTESALMVGMVSVVQFAGPLVLSLWAGVLTDRLDRRRLLMLSRTLSGIAAGVLAGLLALRGIDDFGGAPVLLLCTLVLGIGLGIGAPAMHALVPNLVARHQLEQAIALNAVVGNIARAIGPALGAGLMVLGGPALAFGVAAGGHMIWVLALAVVAAHTEPQPGPRPRLLGGLAYAWGDRKAGRLLLTVATLSFAIDPVITLTPTLAERLGEGDQLVGLLASAFGVGAVIAAMTIQRLRRGISLRNLGVVGMVGAALGLLLIGVGATLPLSVAGFLLTGSGFMLATTALSTRIQRRVPEELRGRVMALWTLAYLGARPLAASSNGYIADEASVEWAMGLGAVMCVMGAAMARVSYRT